MAAVKDAHVRKLAYNATDSVLSSITRSEKWLATDIEIPYRNFTPNVVKQNVDDLPRKIDKNRYKTDDLLRVDDAAVYSL